MNRLKQIIKENLDAKYAPDENYKYKVTYTGTINPYGVARESQLYFRTEKEARNYIKTGAGKNKEYVGIELKSESLLNKLKRIIKEEVHKILKENRELVAYVLSIGVVNMQTGKTQYDWGIYDSVHDSTYVYLTDGRFLLYADNETFKKGDHVLLRNNDSNIKITSTTIIDMCQSKKDAVLKMLYDNQYDYYPKRAFQKSKWKNKLNTSYSVKGTDNIENDKTGRSIRK